MKKSKTSNLLFWLSIFALVLGITWDSLSQYNFIQDTIWLKNISWILSVIFFFFGLLKKIQEDILQLSSNISNLKELVTVIINAELKIASFEDQEKPISDYLDWTSKRYSDLLIHLKDGKLIAPDPDYFKFAENIFSTAEKNIISTSVVDPNWYNGERCVEYIQKQKKIIDNNITYTRIFFCSRNDEAEKTLILRKVIEKQIKLGFNITIVVTDDYKNEKDVALIDAGKLVMEAIVELSNNKPIAEINGCFCYMEGKEFNNVKDDIERIKAYFTELSNRKKIEFDNSNFDSNKLIDFLDMK